MNLLSEIDKKKLPLHIAIIMDGNGRWAKKKGNQRIFGHKNGVTAVRETVEAAAELGIRFLTMYAFSTENWNRPKAEVNALMQLLVSTLHSESKTLMKNNVRLQAIGNIESLPAGVAKQLQDTVQITSKNNGLTLVLALSYSGRWELTNAIRKMAEKVAAHEIAISEIDDDLVSKYMQTAFMPDPELLIRTSGEYRISNFLLWQIAYTEFYFTETLWPDFRKSDLYEAIIDYQNRERRFGKTGDQLDDVTMEADQSSK